MQAHGLAGIYDERVGSVDARTVRLDVLLLETGFISIVLWSPLRLPQLVGYLYDCGLPIIAPAIMDAARGVSVGTVTVAAVA